MIRPASPVVMAAGIYAGMTLPDNGQPMLLLDTGGIAQVTRLPLVAETVDSGATRVDKAERRAASYPALRFIELTGEERAIRLSLVDRVEDVPVAHVLTSGGHCRVRIGDRLIPSPHPVRADQVPPGAKDVTCLRIRDGVRELCYPVRAVIDIGEVPVEMDLSARHGIVAGLVLIDDRQVEVVDGFALMAAVDGLAAEEAARPLCCVIADDDDMWNREILAPLLTQAGYDVRWRQRGEPAAEGEVILVTAGGEDAATALPAERPETNGPERDSGRERAVIRLRAHATPAGPSDTSIYRYDRDALLGALSSFGEERRRA